MSTGDIAVLAAVLTLVAQVASALISKRRSGDKEMDQEDKIRAELYQQLKDANTEIKLWRDRYYETLEGRIKKVHERSKMDNDGGSI